jgi:uncharacterized Zn finger protein (UPF0148 family)
MENCKVCGRDHFLIHSAETICDVCESWAEHVVTQIRSERYAKNLVIYTQSPNRLLPTRRTQENVHILQNRL